MSTMLSFEELKKECALCLKTEIETLDRMVSRGKWLGKAALVLAIILSGYISFGMLVLLAQDPGPKGMVIKAFILRPGLLALAGGLVMLAAVWAASASSRKKNIKWFYKKEVMRNLVPWIGPSLKHTPDVIAPGYVVNHSGLSRCIVADDAAENYFSGMIGGRDHTFAEFEMWKSDSLETGGDSSTRRYARLFCDARFQNNLAGPVYVVSVLAEPRGMRGFFRPRHQVTLEHTEFNKAFKVYSEAKSDAIQVLTPAMMEAILKLQEAMKGVVSLSFKGSHLYVSARVLRDTFEYTSETPMLESETLKELYDIISCLHRMVEAVRSNDRAWNRQASTQSAGDRQSARKNHYAFVHIELPRFIGFEAANLFGEGTEEHKTRVLRLVWDKTAAKYSSADSARYEKGDLHVKMLTIAGCPTAMVNMPKAVAETEAHAVAVVDIGARTGARPMREFRYFTYEKMIDPAAKEKDYAALCEWVGEEHALLKKNLQPELEVFVRELENVVGKQGN